MQHSTAHTTLQYNTLQNKCIKTLKPEPRETLFYWAGSERFCSFPDGPFTPYTQTPDTRRTRVRPTTGQTTPTVNTWRQCLLRTAQSSTPRSRDPTTRPNAPQDCCRATTTFILHNTPGEDCVTTSSPSLTWSVSQTLALCFLLPCALSMGSENHGDNHVSGARPIEGNQPPIALCSFTAGLCVHS